MCRSWSCAAVGLILLAASCSLPNSAVDDRTAPQFLLSSDGEQTIVPAHAYCIPGACATGGPPETLPSVPAANAIVVEATRPGWDLTAVLHVAGAPCVLTYAAPVTRLDPTRFQLEPAGPADRYEVRLWSQGPGGSAEAAFLWTTTINAPTPAEPC